MQNIKYIESDTTPKDLYEEDMELLQSGIIDITSTPESFSEELDKEFLSLEQIRCLIIDNLDAIIEDYYSRSHQKRGDNTKLSYEDVKNVLELMLNGEMSTKIAPQVSSLAKQNLFYKFVFHRARGFLFSLNKYDLEKYDELVKYVRTEVRKRNKRRH